MPSIPVLEVAISLALLYLFFSQVVSSLFEMWAVAVNKRGHYLRRYLNQALNSGSDKNWAELVYRHPTVDMLAQKTTRPPVYVPSGVFVKAIVDLVIDEVREHTFVDTADVLNESRKKALAGTPGEATFSPAPQTGSLVYKVVEPTGTSLANFKAGLDRVPEGDFKALMRTLLVNAQGCTTCAGAEGDEKVFAEFIHGLAVWYDGYMERVSGWYKRSIRWQLLLLGLMVAVAGNIDSLRVASYLWSHSAERQRIVAYAAKQAADSSNMRRLLRAPGQDSLGLRVAARRYVGRVDSLSTALQALGFPIGWSFRKQKPEFDTLYQAVRPLPLPDGWQRQPYWVRHTLARVVAPYRNAPGSKVGQTRLVWRPDTLLALRPGLRLAPLGAAGADTVAHRTPIGRPRNVPAAALSWAATGPLSNDRPAGPWWALLGWLLTAAALSVGAPFWFEVLGRFVNMRNVGVRPPSSLATPAKEPS